MLSEICCSDDPWGGWFLLHLIMVLVGLSMGLPNQVLMDQEVWRLQYSEVQWLSWMFFISCYENLFNCAIVFISSHVNIAIVSDL